jgi:membrane fusion protein (multidrug efflux system)
MKETNMSQENANANADTNAQPAAPAAQGNTRRRKALTAIAAAVAVIGLGWGAYEWLVASHYESTDNAYVQGNVVQITPQIGGTVVSVYADDTDFVKAGQPLIQLDPADARVALDQAEANLAQTVRQVRTLYANNGSLAAQVSLREADVVKARSEVDRANDDLNRRSALVGNGAVSKEELNHSQTALQNARSSLAAAEAAVVAAREQLASNQTQTEGTTVEQHPSVMAAAAKVREAWLASQRAALPAPIEGYVAKRTVQVGQRVAAGAPLMSIIPLRQVWVDANFKEGQLRKIRIGQPVTLTADVYGKKVEYHGTVEGLGAGTGSAFALLPAQNATGNWIKVVQRVPVRVALDPKEIVANPLRVGLSMDAEVDVSKQDGKALAEAPRAAPVAQTTVFNLFDKGADAEVQRVIAANIGRGTPTNLARTSKGQSLPVMPALAKANVASASANH